MTKMFLAAFGSKQKLFSIFLVSLKVTLRVFITLKNEELATFVNQYYTSVESYAGQLFQFISQHLKARLANCLACTNGQSPAKGSKRFFKFPLVKAFPRRSSLAPSGPQSSRLISQPSQQSFSQGISSQHTLFSQISQSLLDEVVTTDQRFGSQERENTAKMFSSLPPTNFTREDGQMLVSRSSTNLIRKWNSASAPEHRCQTSEELEHPLSLIETSLNRMILDTVQSDVMQVNKGTKEVLLEMEGIQQKLIAEDTSLQLMNKGQEVIKASLDGSMKEISDQLNKDIHRDKLQQFFLVLSALPEQTEASLIKLQNELSNTFTNEIKFLSGNCLQFEDTQQKRSSCYCYST
ncbi:protein PAIR1-like [Durio zibethinus]|uniref:Protein PAIR1-like n=1 Tax=Durio zibethinus TaxID=66656 RepID=A0A6P6AXM7_DURZI|nr:protein PAIR1-like [Durio zibethinus]